jgi:superkiller protein 3
MSRISIQEEDWADAVACSEKGKSLVRALQERRGTLLPRSMTSLDVDLGVALVQYYPPKHHSRASKLLSGVLSKDQADTHARFALGQILQAAAKWKEARGHFQIILDTGGDHKEVVAAQEEVGWCLVNEGNLTGGRDVLEQVVELRDTRVETEGKDDEALARARAWWRLGHTEWMIGGELCDCDIEMRSCHNR